LGGGGPARGMEYKKRTDRKRKMVFTDMGCKKKRGRMGTKGRGIATGRTYLSHQGGENHVKGGKSRDKRPKKERRTRFKVDRAEEKKWCERKGKHTMQDRKRDVKI